MDVEAKELVMFFKKIYTWSVLSTIWTSELRYSIASFTIQCESILTEWMLWSDIVYTSDTPINMRYEENDCMIRYKHIRIAMFSDTLFDFKWMWKSIISFTWSQVFTTDFGWISDTTMKLEEEINLVFKVMYQRNGIT